MKSDHCASERAKRIQKIFKKKGVITFRVYGDLVPADFLVLIGERPVATGFCK
jgi:hypothetical protein